MSKLDKVQKYIEKGKELDLLKLFHDKDKEVRLAAIAGAGKVGKDDSFNALIILLTDEDADIRAQAATALGALRNSHGDAHLRYCLGKETDAKVAAAIRNALALLHEEGR